MGDLVPVIATLASSVSCSVLCKDPAGMKRKFVGDVLLHLLLVASSSLKEMELARMAAVVNANGDTRRSGHGA